MSDRGYFSISMLELTNWSLHILSTDAHDMHQNGVQDHPPPLMTLIIVLLNLYFTVCSFKFLVFINFNIVHLFLPLDWILLTMFDWLTA